MMAVAPESKLAPTRLLTPAACELAFRVWGPGQGLGIGVGAVEGEGGRCALRSHLHPYQTLGLTVQVSELAFEVWGSIC